MGIEDLIKPVKRPEPIVPEIQANQEVKQGIHSGGGKPDCFWKMEWNTQTRKIFDKGRTPRQGRRYVFKCDRFNGREAFFTLEQL